VDRSVDEDCVGPFALETRRSFLAPVGGTVVHDPEDTASGLAGFLRHHVAYEPIHGSNAVFITIIKVETSGFQPDSF